MRAMQSGRKRRCTASMKPVEPLNHKASLATEQRHQMLQAIHLARGLPKRA
jgi:hypothetical protein